MAKVSDTELIKLVSVTFDRAVAENLVAIDNVSVSVATALVRAVREAGMVVIRDERDRSIDAVDPALVARLRQAVPA